MKASGSEDDFFARWSGQQAKLANARQELDSATRTLAVVPPGLAGLVSVAVLGIGAWQVMRGTLTVGTLVAFQSLLVGFLGPASRLVLFSSLIQEIGGSLARLDDVLRYPLDRRWLATLMTGDPPPPQGQLELRHLTFGYRRLDPPLLADFNLTIGPGQRVALIGGTVSGKSTIARLAAGLLMPWSGEVLLDGRPLADLPPATLVGALALVDQEIALFGGTVRDNLTLWDSTIPEERLVAAARDAGLHEELVARPGGYDAVVDEGGRNFSGGQRQRLELARALDNLKQAEVMRQLAQLRATRIVIAHRLSTIQGADRIYVLVEGRVAQVGRYDELAAEPGPFQDLIRRQQVG